MSDEILSAVVTTLHLLFFTGAAGVVACNLWLLPPGFSRDPNNGLTLLRLRLWRWLGVCVFGLALSGSIELLLRAASMAEVPLRDAAPAIKTVLLETHVGELWWWRAGALLIVGLAWLVDRPREDGRLTSLFQAGALGVMGYALAITGHAGDDGAFTTAAIANAVHVIGAAMWGGGILVAALVMLPVLRHCDPFPRYTLSFASVSLSSMSTLALALVLFPGIYHAWLQLGSVNALWDTLYGRWLLAKIGFVAVMIALGALNRFLHVPEMERLADESALATSPLTRAIIRERSETSAVSVFIRNLRLEGAFLLMVLIGAAVLSQQTPSIHEHHQDMMSEQNLHQH